MSLNQDNPNVDQSGHGSKVLTFIGAFCLLLAAVSYVFVLQPMKSDLSVLKADVSQQLEKETELSEQIAGFEKAQNELDLSTEVQRFEILKRIPAEMYQDEVIRDLIEIIESYDITLNSIGFGKGSAMQEGVGVLKVNASFEGNYSDLENFLEGLETNARLFQVESINVQVNDLAATGFKRATFSLAINAFYQQ